MPRLYLQGLTDAPSPLKDHVNSWYTRDPQKAAALATREEAALICSKCEQHSFELTTVKGNTHVCAGFKVEERIGVYFVFCEAPLSAGEAGTAAGGVKPRAQSTRGDTS